MTYPDNAPAHVRKAIDLALRRYEKAVADYKTHKAGQRDEL